MRSVALVLALVGAVLVVSITAQSSDENAGFPPQTSWTRERVGRSWYWRRNNPNICDNQQTNWKNSDAAAKEEAIRKYKAAAKAFTDKAEVIEKSKSAYDQERAKLDSKAVSLKMDLASLVSSQDFQTTQVQAFMGRRSDAVREARRVSTMTRASQTAMQNLKSTIKTLALSLDEMKAQENAVEQNVAQSTSQILNMIEAEGQDQAKTKSDSMTLQQQIEDRTEAIETLSARIDSLTQTVSDLSLRQNETLRKVEALHTKRASLERERSRLQREIAALEIEIGKEFANLDRANEDKIKAQQDAAKIQSDQMEVEQQANSGTRQAAMLEEEKAKLQETLAKNKENLATMSGSIAALSERRASLEHELESLSNASLALHSHESILLTAHQELQANATVANEHLAALRGQLEAALVSVKKSEIAAEQYRSEADQEAIAGKAAHSKVMSLTHKATMRHASHVKAMAEGLMGDCDCSQDFEGCSKCGPDGPSAAMAENAANDPLANLDGQSSDPRVGMESEIQAALARASTAIDQSSSEHMSPEEASAVGKATQMLQQANEMLSTTKDALVEAAHAHGLDPTSVQDAPILSGGKDATELMTNQEAVSLAMQTEHRASEAKQGLEHALAEEAGHEATKSLQQEIGDSAAAEMRAVEDSESARIDSPPPEGDGDVPRFRQKERQQQALRAGSQGRGRRSNNDGYQWSQECKNYVAATKRWNAAAADLTSAVHLTEVSRVKYERIKEQVVVSEAARNASRAVVEELSEEVSNTTAKVQAMKARVDSLRAEIAKIEGSMSEAVAGLTSAQTQVQNLQFDKDDLTEKEAAERKVLDRARAQDARVSTQLNAEQEHVDAERKANLDHITSLKQQLATLETDLSARNQRVAQLIQEQDETSTRLAVAESEEERAEDEAKRDEAELEESHKTHDEKEAEADKIHAKVDDAVHARALAEEAAKAASAAVASAQTTIATTRTRTRQLRGELERAKAQMHSSNGMHALETSDQFNLDIAIRHLQDKVESRKLDVDALKTRLANLAGEMAAFELSTTRNKEAAKEMTGAIAKEEARKNAASEVESLELQTLNKLRSEKEAEQATLDTLAKTRNMVPPGAAQQLQEASSKREALEAEVGGPHGDAAAELVAEPFVSPAIAEPGALVSHADAVPPEVEAALAMAQPPQPAPEPAKQEPEEPEIDMEPQSSAEQDSAALDKAAEEAVVQPEDLPGATGDPSTDALIGSSSSPAAEPVDAIQPPPFAGGPAQQPIPEPPMP